MNPRVPIPVGIAIAAAVAIGFLYFLARWALYHPSKYPEGYWDTQQSVGASDAWMETSDGVKIHGWWVQRDGSPLRPCFCTVTGTISLITRRTSRRSSRRDLRFSCLDYRGYGKSSGRPSEQDCTEIAKRASSICSVKAIGRSRLLSTASHSARAVAIDLASRRPCAALILEAPFTSASDVAGTVVPFIGPLLIRSFNSLPKIRWIRVPMFFMQGDRDEVIPLRLGQELFAAAQEPKTFWIIPGAGHNDILETAGAEYRHRLSAFYKALPSSHS